MASLSTQIAQWANWLAKHPELSWQEEKTTQYVIEQLGPNFVWKGETGVIYALGPQNGLPFICRAELDALQTEFGPRHVCGHHLHLAALMATYVWLKNQPSLTHRYYFVFQPSEEHFPSGAKWMEEQLPVLKSCRAALAFHVFPGLALGEVANPIFAGGDYFEIEIKGQATHIKNVSLESIKADALLGAARLISQINNYLRQNSVVHVGVVEGGSTANAIAGSAILKGDVRYHTLKAAKLAAGFLQRTVSNAQRAFPHLEFKLRYFNGYPVLHNDPFILKKTQGIWPKMATITSFATEDFSLYSAPKGYFLIGTGETTELHDPNFAPSTKVAEMIFAHWQELMGLG